MARKNISIQQATIQYSRSRKVFGVLLGLGLISVGGVGIYKFKPTIFTEISIISTLMLGIIFAGGWISGKSKWGLFLGVLILGLPILFRLNWLNIAAVAVWVLILGLISLIN